MNKKIVLSTIAALATFGLLIGLGTWQVQRLFEKKEVIALANTRAALPIAPLPYHINGNHYYQRFTITGTLHPEKAIYQFAGRLESIGAVGYYMIAPITRHNGQTILVNLGWIPEGERPFTQLQSQEVGLTVQSVPLHNKGWLTPNNHVEHNQWFWHDIEAIRAYTQLPIAPILLRKIASDLHSRIAYPIAGQASLNIRNDHLQYAITWYALAIILLVVLAVVIRNHILTTKQ